MPPTHHLTMSEVFDETEKPRHAVLKSHFVQEGRIEEDVALRIIRDATAILRKERNVLEVEAPITGQYFYWKTLDFVLICCCSFRNYSQKLLAQFRHIKEGDFLQTPAFVLFSVWWYSWPILRSYEAFRSRWLSFNNALSFPWRLCGPGLFFNRGKACLYLKMKEWTLAYKT